MKKVFLTVILVCCIILSPRLYACTNFIITKGASSTGSCMVTYAADSHTLYGELYFQPAADHPAGSFREVIEWDSGKRLGQIPEVAHTYSVIGNMNEHQLVIGETTYGGRSELWKTPGLSDYGSLIYITLQRAKTAREAIKVISGLLDAYGYCSEGESFSIAVLCAYGSQRDDQEDPFQAQYGPVYGLWRERTSLHVCPRVFR